jgi:2-polyprenyl-6-methoxyphenol hydroxylase-like FAD-dependent oxidoreductase
VRCGHAIVAIEDDGRRLRDETGRLHGPYDLVILADGSASRLREAIGTPHLNRPYPWGALWCLLAQRDWPHADELRQRYRAARRMMGLLPVGTRPDDPVPRMSFFWSLPADDFERWRRDGLEHWREEATALWPEAAPYVAEIDQPAKLLPATYRDAVLKRWHRAPVVLLGDAAHAMSPQLGQGVNMALMDALALRESLRARPAEIPAALAAYEQERRAHSGAYQFWSRWLTPLFQSNRDLAARLRDLTFIPAARMPIGRGYMVRVLTGTQKGWVGRIALAEDFLDALALELQGPAKLADNRAASALDALSLTTDPAGLSQSPLA